MRNLLLVLIATLLLVLLVGPQRLFQVAYEKCLENRLGFCQKIEKARLLFFEPEFKILSNEALIQLIRQETELQTASAEVLATTTVKDVSTLPGFLGQFEEWALGRTYKIKATVVVPASSDLSQLSISQDQELITFYIQTPRIHEAYIREDTVQVEQFQGLWTPWRGILPDIIPLLDKPDDQGVTARKQLIEMATQEAIEQGLLEKAQQKLVDWLTNLPAQLGDKRKVNVVLIEQ